MIVRTIVTLGLMGLLCVVSGCEPPKPKAFVDGSKETALLRPEIVNKVRPIVDSHFGSPHELVASLELPVDFGRIEGEVLAVTGGLELGKHQLVVSLKGGSYDAADLNGLGLLWKTGNYTESAYTEGAGATGDPSFHVIDYQTVDGGSQILSLNCLFGEPVEVGATFEIVGAKLRKGRKFYMQHCMHCHGYSGDGNGPTAKTMNPLPRDYRLGTFKFKSTEYNERPSRADLKRTVQNGIRGTYMPSFLLLAEDELDAIIEYVRWLSMRGELENKLVGGQAKEYKKAEADWSALIRNAAEVKSQENFDAAVEKWEEGGEKGSKPLQANFVTSDSDAEKIVLSDMQEYLNGKVNEKGDVEEGDFKGESEEAFASLVEAWSRVEVFEKGKSESRYVVRPKSARVPSDAASIARGRELYLNKATCHICHGKMGKGDGPQVDVGLKDDWGVLMAPRDLTTGIYRGGRRPIDLYRRIRAGIKGTPMPAFGNLTDEEVWDLVNYILDIPLSRKK